jgi:hypothetical protein
MPRLWLALPLALALAAPAAAGLKLQDIKARHGAHGPERASLDVAPGDEVVFTYTLTGVGTDPDGKVDCELRQTISDAGGKVLLDNKTPIKEALGFGGGYMPGVAAPAFGITTPPGKYVVKVTITDKLREETVSFERAVTVVKPDFAVVRPRLSYDAQGKSAAGLTNVLGTQLFFRMIAVGFDRSQKKIDMTMTVHYYDDKGKDLLPKPLMVSTKTDDEEKVAKADSVTFNGSFACNRPGSFKVKIVITDNMAKKSATFEVPLKVVE